MRRLIQMGLAGMLCVASTLNIGCPPQPVATDYRDH